MKLNNSDLLTVPSTFRNLKKLKKIIFNDDKIESFYHTESSKRNYHYYMKSFQKELPSNCEIVLGYQ